MLYTSRKVYEFPNSTKKLVAKLVHGVSKYLPTYEDTDG
jgi:hypothetical protein